MTGRLTRAVPEAHVGVDAGVDMGHREMDNCRGEANPAKPQHCRSAQPTRFGTSTR